MTRDRRKGYLDSGFEKPMEWSYIYFAIYDEIYQDDEGAHGEDIQDNDDDIKGDDDNNGDHRW